ncbi:MAG: hypothetical protein COZ72_03555 [Elusimicrobia bacterium CG_4_8_14_3_um_filter_50_9]|nr:MAG: hypothetical protein COZ72_03555 [Elusimicrobia bacterium CG_4_8_14_3_um_filter_50_9]
MRKGRERGGEMSRKKEGRPLFLFLTLLFAFLIVWGLCLRRHIVTGGIAGHICLECMGFK